MNWLLRLFHRKSPFTDFDKNKYCKWINSISGGHDNG